MRNIPIKKNFSCEIDLHLIPRVFQAKKKQCTVLLYGEHLCLRERGQILKLSSAKSEINLIADATTLLEEGQRQNAAFCVSSPYITIQLVESKSVPKRTKICF